MLFSRGLILQYEKLQQKYIGPWFRRTGQKLYKYGASIQGDLFHEDRLVPSLRCVPSSKTKFPKLIKSEWIAPNSTVIGDVETGKYSSLYHGVLIKADNVKVNIGKLSVIQDNTKISNPHNLPNAEIKIGDSVVIGVNCNIHVCVIEDNAIIGNGATIHDGCIIEEGAMVAPGAVVKPNTKVPANQIWAGNPAKYLRDIKPNEKAYLLEHRNELNELASVMGEETEKTHAQIINDEDEYEIRNFTSFDELYINELMQYGNFTESALDDFGVEGNIEGYDDFEQEDLIRYTSGRIFNEESMDNHYDQDYKQYPDSLIKLK